MLSYCVVWYDVSVLPCDVLDVVHDRVPSLLVQRELDVSLVHGLVSSLKSTGEAYLACIDDD